MVKAQKKALHFKQDVLSEMLVEAGIENKILFIDCYTQWCGPCKRMDKDVFTNDKVADFYSTNFLCYKVDMDSLEGKEFRINYNVKSYPTFLFIDANGKLVDLLIGGNFTPDEFLNQGKEVIKGTYTYVALKQLYEEGRRTDSIVAKYLIAQMNASKFEYSLFREYLSTQDDNKLSKPDNIWLLINGAIYDDSNRFSVDGSEYKWMTKNTTLLEKFYSKQQIKSRLLMIPYLDVQLAIKTKDRGLFNKAIPYLESYDDTGVLEYSRLGGSYMAMLVMNDLSLKQKINFYSEIRQNDTLDFLENLFIDKNPNKSAAYLTLAFNYYFGNDSDIKRGISYVLKAIEINRNAYSMHIAALLYKKSNDLNTAKLWANETITLIEGEEKTPQTDYIKSKMEEIINDGSDG